MRALALTTALGLAAMGWAAAGAAPAPKEFRDCPDCPVMIALPGGTFQMGDASPTSRTDEHPVHPVKVAAFAAGKFEVTRGEYAAFVAATNRQVPPGCRTDSNLDGQYENDPAASWSNPGPAQTDRDPVVCVNWADATAYAAWLSQTTGKAYRLLSEAEWEYAARAGSTTQYWWGDSADELCAYANGPDRTALARFPGWAGKTAACDDGAATSAPVGSHRPNVFGLYDMAGGAWEWTADCYAPGYGAQPSDGSAYVAEGCQRRTLRGGSWVYGLGDLRSSQRNGLPPPWMRGGDLGFRVARSLP